MRIGFTIVTNFENKIWNVYITRGKCPWAFFQSICLPSFFVWQVIFWLFLKIPSLVFSSGFPYKCRYSMCTILCLDSFAQDNDFKIHPCFYMYHNLSSSSSLIIFCWAVFHIWIYQCLFIHSVGLFPGFGSYKQDGYNNSYRNILVVRYFHFFYLVFRSKISGFTGYINCKKSRKVPPSNGISLHTHTTVIISSSNLSYSLFHLFLAVQFICYTIWYHSSYVRYSVLFNSYLYFFPSLCLLGNCFWSAFSSLILPSACPGWS